MTRAYRTVSDIALSIIALRVLMTTETAEMCRQDIVTEEDDFYQGER